MNHLTQRPAAARTRQQGAALIVTVLLMMVISMLAITAMMRNNIDERMAFNQRDRQVALQAAEAALREAEDAIVGRFGAVLDESFFSGREDCTTAAAAGWCYPGTGSNDWSALDAAAWTAGNAARTLTLNTRANITGVSEQPRYLIEYQGAVDLGPGNPCVARFLITARAVGLNANSTVTLQSQFRSRIGVCLKVV